MTSVKIGVFNVGHSAFDAVGHSAFDAKDKSMTTQKNAPPTSVWSPLTEPAFRIFWGGMSLSTAAFWMQNIAVTWLMKSWTDSDPVMVSLVQTALFLPVMVLSLPAGSIADKFDRRRLLMISQVAMMLAPLSIAVLALMNIESPVALLACTALLAVGNALKLPCQSALLPALIDKDRLPFAVSLFSMAINGGRIIGPGLAGALLPLVGAMALFLGNSMIYLLYVLILWRLPIITTQQHNNTSSFIKGLVDLKDWVVITPSYATILLRGGLYFCAWATILAVVPLIADSAADFGILYGVFGAGAITGASLYGYSSRLGTRSSAVTVAIMLHAACIFMLSFADTFIVQAVLMALVGSASFFVMTTLQVSAQLQLPDKIRGRGLALMTTVFMGATALSSPIWGSLADALTADMALRIAGGASAIFALLLAGRRIEPPSAASPH